MSLSAETQEASVSLSSLRVRDLRRLSIASVRSPVSIAVELATALTMLARETVTLAEVFLRIIKRLQRKIASSMITSGGHHVLQPAPWTAVLRARLAVVQRRTSIPCRRMYAFASGMVYSLK